MSKVIFYAAALIGVFLILVYYKGATSDVNAGAHGLGRLILFLQGRNSTGQLSNYPH